jgi:hypothetical protein
MSKPKKPRPITDFDVVFSDKGDLAWNSRTSGYYAPPNFKTEKNHPYSDSLEYTGYAGSHILFTSLNTGRKYHMFMSDFDEAVKAKAFINNQLVGIFCFCRKGTKQGIRLILEP